MTSDQDSAQGDSNSHDEERLAVLLDEWELAVERGEEVALNSLCHDVPHLLEPLRERVSALKSMSALLAPTPTPMPAGLPGYRFVRELGAGGMGVVYYAEQEQLGRPVAIKTLKGVWSSAAERERLAREAEALARLNHDHIVGVHDVVEHDGRLFLILEYVDGGTLADRIRRSPFSDRDAASATLTLTEAMADVHREGVLHRDLKPGNVLVTQTGRLKITDFGLAKTEQLGNQETATGAILGSPSYLSPEQANGQQKLIGVRSDVYGLGTILYELLTKRPPFSAATPLETIEQVCREEPVRPRRLNPSVTRDLETICLKCLEKSPNRRYENCRELAADLQRHLDGRPIAARSNSSLERMWRLCRRHPERTLFVAVLTVALLVAAGLIGRAVSRRQSAEYERALLQRALTAEEASRRQQQVYAAISRLQNRRLNVLPGWTWKNEAEVAEVLKLTPSPTERLVLREEAVACSATPDTRRHGALHEDLEGYCSAYNHDGSLLAIGANGAYGLGTVKIRLYDDRGTLLKELSYTMNSLTFLRRGTKDGVRSLAFSHRRNLLAVGGRFGEIHFFELKAFRHLGYLGAHTDWVNSIVFLQDDDAILTGSRDGTIKRWKLSEPSEGSWIPPSEPSASSRSDQGSVTAIIPNGDLVHVVTRQGRVTLSTKDLKEVRRISTASLPRVAPFADGTGWIASAGQRLLHCPEFLEAEEDSLTLGVHPARIDGVRISPAGQLAASWDREGVLKIWDLCSLQLITSMVLPSTPKDVQFSARHDRMVVLYGSRADLFDVRKTALEARYISAGKVLGVGLSQNGRVAACVHATSDGAELSVGHFIQNLPLSPVAVIPDGDKCRLAFSFDSRRLAIAQPSIDQLVLVDLKSADHHEERTKQHTLRQSRLGDVCVLNDQQLCYVAAVGNVQAKAANTNASSIFTLSSDDDAPKLLWVNQQPAALMTQRSRLLSLSAGGNKLLAPSHDGNVYLVDKDGQATRPIANLRGAKEVGWLSANGLDAILGDDEGKISVVDLALDDVWKEDDLLNARITAVTARGSWVAAGSVSGEVGLWRVNWPRRVSGSDLVTSEGTLEPYVRLPRLSGGIQSLAFNPTATKLLVHASGEHGVRILDLEEALSFLAGFELAN